MIKGNDKINKAISLLEAVTGKKISLEESKYNITARTLGPYTTFWVYKKNDNEYVIVTKGDLIVNPDNVGNRYLLRGKYEYVEGFDKDGYIVTHLNYDDKTLGNTVYDYQRALLNGKAELPLNAEPITKKEYDLIVDAYITNSNAWFIPDKERLQILNRKYHGDEEAAESEGKKLRKIYGLDLHKNAASKFDKFKQQQAKTLNTYKKDKDFGIRDLKQIISDYNINPNRIDDMEYLKTIALEIYRMPIVNKYMKKRNLGVDDLVNDIKKQIR